MDIIFYDATGRDRRLEPKALTRIQPQESNLLWLNGPAEEIAALHPPAELSEAIACSTDEPVRVRVHDSFYYLSIPVLPPSGEATSANLVLLVGQNWLVSMGPQDATDFTNVIELDVGETMKGYLSGTTLATALLAEHFARFHRHIATVDSEIDRVEQRTLTGAEGRSTLQVLTVLRRRTARMRQVLSELRPIVASLTRPDFLPLITPDDRKHMLHLEDSFEKLSDEIVRLRETVVGSFELYATRIAQDTNRLLKALTILTLGIGLVGAAAGVMGMNFKLAWFEQGARAFAPVVTSMGLLLALTILIGLAAYRRN